MVSAILFAFIGTLGFAMILWSLKRGRSNFWMGKQLIEVTREKDRLLFWVSIVGSALLLVGWSVGALIIIEAGK